MLQYRTQVYTGKNVQHIETGRICRHKQKCRLNQKKNVECLERGRNVEDQKHVEMQNKQVEMKKQIFPNNVINGKIVMKICVVDHMLL